MLMPSFDLRQLKELVPMLWGKAVKITKVIEDPKTGEAVEGEGKERWKIINLIHYSLLVRIWVRFLVCWMTMGARANF